MSLSPTLCENALRFFRSAAGKSHLCLQLAITSQLPHLTCDPGGVILLTSERKPSKDRLREIAQHALPAHSSVSSHRGPRTVAELLSNVHTKHVIEVPEARKLFLESLTDEQRLEHETSEVEMLELALAHHIPSTIEALAAAGRPKIRLLLVDSIGALFRASFDNSHSGLSQRSTMLCQISDKLKVLATRYDLAVVVVNQVTDVFDRASTADAMSYAMQSRFFSGQTSDLAKEASLGLVWANSVNVRVMLSRTGRRRKLNHGDLSQKRTRLSAYDREVLLEAGQDPEADYESTLIRRMHLVFSPFAPEAMLDFVIIESGIHSLATSKTQPRHAYISEPPPELADSPEYALDDIDLHAWEAVEQEALLDVSGTAPADDMPDSDDEPNDHEAQ